MESSSSTGHSQNAVTPSQKKNSCLLQFPVSPSSPAQIGTGVGQSISCKSIVLEGIFNSLQTIHVEAKHTISLSHLLALCSSLPLLNSLIYTGGGLQLEGGAACGQELQIWFNLEGQSHSSVLQNMRYYWLSLVSSPSPQQQEKYHSKA